ncbi:MAG: chorismate mutase [Aliidongia sp.]
MLPEFGRGPQQYRPHRPADLALVAERGTFVREAGRFKANPAAVDDPKRVEQIITKIRGLAEQDHLSPDVAEATYRAMIAPSPKTSANPSSRIRRSAELIAS